MRYPVLLICLNVAWYYIPVTEVTDMHIWYVTRSTDIQCARYKCVYVFSLNTVDKEYHLLVQEVSTGGGLQKAGGKVPHIPPKPVVSQGQVGY